MKFVIPIFVLLFVFAQCENSTESKSGCTDATACNYDASATDDDGSCLYEDCAGDCGGDAIVDCTGICGGAYREDDCGTCLHPENDAFIWNAECSGCTDENAVNYDPDAIVDNGSCIEENPEGWALVWNDEFNGESIDYTNWTHEEWGPYHVNNELQAYTSRNDNSWVEDGRLIIRAQAESYDGADYTSARLHSAGKREFRYGRFDIRAKLPMATGAWPAIWMLGTNIGDVGWPACGEIDIMEHVNEDNTVHSSLHAPGCYHALAGYPEACVDYNIHCPGGCVNPLPNTYWYGIADPGDWHVYGMIWTPDYMQFTIDDKAYVTMVKPSGAGEYEWPFEQPFFFILNFAVGGNWPGDPDPSEFPAQMEIDFVRVYESTE